MFVNIILHSIWIQVCYEPLITFLGSSNVMGFMKMCHSPGLLVRGFFIGCHSFHCLTLPRSSRQSDSSGAALNGVVQRTVNRVEGS